MPTSDTAPSSRRYVYSAIEIKQQPDAAPFYLLTVSAPELLEWAAAPEKLDSFMAGYQRSLDDRHHTIKEFIEKSPKNVLPGAVILATKPGTTAITDTALPAVKQVAIDVAAHTFEAELRAVTDAFRARLRDDERADADAICGKILATGGSGGLPVETSEEPDGAEAEIDESMTPPRSYLSVLTGELLAGCEAFDRVTPTRQQAIRDYVASQVLPGLILDGQHRVNGAKNVNDFDVMLPVVLLPDLEVQEQVFHFYVVNNKATPLSPTQLRSTISTSLTNHEIDDLYKRFAQAGVRAERARLTHRMNSDRGSPFHELIDFGLGASQAFLKENVMYQVAQKFVDMSRKYRLIYKTPTTPIAWTDDQDRYDYRLQKFYVFWGAIRDVYPAAWEAAVSAKGGQILYKAAMLTLQEKLLDVMVTEQPAKSAQGTESPLLDDEALATFVRNALHFLPEEFFTRTWMKTQLDTSTGREFLYDQMTKAIQKQGRRLGDLDLFKA